MVTFLALGFLFFGNVNANAQNTSFAGKITPMIELRDSFAPGTAKYDTVQDAIDYLEVLESNFNANPNYLRDLADTTGKTAFESDKIRRTHPSILANYSAAQLAEFQAEINESNSATNQNPQAAQKTQWILDANAY